MMAYVAGSLTGLIRSIFPNSEAFDKILASARKHRSLNPAKVCFSRPRNLLKSFYSKGLLPQKPFTPQALYTRSPVRQKPFTPQALYTRNALHHELLYTGIMSLFTPKAKNHLYHNHFKQKLFAPEALQRKTQQEHPH